MRSDASPFEPFNPNDELDEGELTRWRAIQSNVSPGDWSFLEKITVMREIGALRFGRIEGIKEAGRLISRHDQDSYSEIINHAKGVGNADKMEDYAGALTGLYGTPGEFDLWLFKVPF